MTGLTQREALRQLLRRDGILYAGPTQPIRHINGESAPWAFYSWNVSLTPEGLRLIAANMVERLETFRSTQLASYGYTGLPILSACIALGGGRYTGIGIREQRKQSVACRRIDGPLDPMRSVVIVDDSISSGTSLGKAIAALEAEGFEVEGSLALVRFPGRGGCEFAQLNGYRAEYLFDIWDDLGMRIEGADQVRSLTAVTGGGRIPDGLDPADAARRAMEYFLSTGYAPQPPSYLDKNYDGRGGVFVSLRERATDYRIAREGFWHFDPREFRLGPDIVRAAIETFRTALAISPQQRLESWKIGVTFFQPLEKIEPRQLDFDRFGIVVRSKMPPYRCGGALPNTQVFISEIEQYHQARVNNARLSDYEEHELFRHDLTKSVEDGEDWLPYGCMEGAPTNWWRDSAIGEQLTAYAAQVVERVLSGEKVPQSVKSLPELICAIEAAAVTLYETTGGRRLGLAGYGLSWGGDLRRALTEAAQTAATDERARRLKGLSGPRPFSVVVSVLHHPELLLHLPLSEIIRKIRRGLDSVSVSVDNRRFTLLPSLIPYNNFSREQYVHTRMRQAGITQGGEWTTYQTATWVRCPQGVYPLRFGFPHRADMVYGLTECEADMRLLGSFIFRNLRANGLPLYSLSPVSGEIQERGSAGRLLHGLFALGAAAKALGETEWRGAATHGLRLALQSVTGGHVVLEGEAGGALADCVLLAGVSVLDRELAGTREATMLAQSIAGLLQEEGSIRRGRKRLSIRHDHDYLPGGALWAIGSYCQTTGCALPDKLDSQLAFYRRRFLAVPTWGAAGWQPQGWHAVQGAGSIPGAREFIYQAADWAIERQLEKNGAFLEDLSPDEPSFNTGFLAEGIGAAWAEALGADDADRAAKYEKSWRRAMAFTRKLMIREEDTFCMREPARAVGGVRCMQSRSDVRIDQVSHCLHALVRGWQCLQSSIGQPIDEADFHTLVARTNN
jgi:AMMECR1 domain-containing protein/orotate phosphoribosyltransferase